MRYIILTLTLLFSLSAYSQIEIDEPTEKKVEAIPYDGSFMTLPYSVSDGMGLGLVGEKVTLLDVSTFDVEGVNGERVSYSDDDNFKNKTYEIIAYEKDIYPTFTIKSDLGSYKWKVKSTSKYVFNKFLDAIKVKLLNKTYTPLYNTKEVEALDGTKLTIDGATEYQITKVSFTKFSFDYGIKVQLNNEFELKYPLGDYDQPTTFVKGEGNIPSVGWINLQGGALLASEHTLIEKDVFEKFKSENKSAIDNIRNQVVAVGMTEQQCRWAWGRPNKSFGALAGYDIVYDWGGKSLYFKDDKLALIR